jgi:hypothetical protein
MNPFQKFKEHVARLVVSLVVFIATITKNSKLIADIRGTADMEKAIEIIAVLFVAGVMLPQALIYLSNASAYSGVSPAVIVVCTVLLPVLGVISIAMLYIKLKK